MDREKKDGFANTWEITDVPIEMNELPVDSHTYTELYVEMRHESLPPALLH